MCENKNIQIQLLHVFVLFGRKRPAIILTCGAAVNPGDIVGTSLNGLDQLIQIPNGCGEQTMLNLAPIVHILAYLRSTGLLNAQIESKCKAYMLSGKIHSYTMFSFSSFP